MVKHSIAPNGQYIRNIDPNLSPSDVFRDFWKWNYFVGKNSRYELESYSDAQKLGPAPFPSSEADARITYNPDNPLLESDRTIHRSSAKMLQIRFDAQRPTAAGIRGGSLASFTPRSNTSQFGAATGRSRIPDSGGSLELGTGV